MQGVSAGTHSGRAVSVGERATGKDVMAGIAGIPAQLEREGEIIQLYVQLTEQDVHAFIVPEEMQRTSCEHTA